MVTGADSAVADKNLPWLLLRSLRPKQWTKNLIIFAPALFAQKIHDPKLVLAACLCFIAFCMVSGSVYIFNDLIDAPADRNHPKKSKRPIASGALNPKLALLFAILVCALGIAFAFVVRPAVAVIVITYLVLQAAYVLVLKNHSLIDIGCIASGFVLRAVAGAAAVHVPASAWFLLCTGLVSLFIALEKRRQEIKALDTNAVACRKALKDYSMELVTRLESLILSGLLFSYVLYTILSWHGQWMMLTIPFILYGMGRYIQLSIDSTLAAAPEDVLLKDRPIQITFVSWVIVSGLIVYDVLPKFILSSYQYIESFKHLL